MVVAVIGLAFALAAGQTGSEAPTPTSEAAAVVATPPTTTTTTTPAAVPVSELGGGEAELVVAVVDQFPRTDPVAALNAVRATCHALRSGEGDPFGPGVELELVPFAYFELARVGVTKVCPDYVDDLASAEEAAVLTSGASIPAGGSPPRLAETS
jgi:hypothetical protein